jgi:hypothetical protein
VERGWTGVDADLWMKVIAWIKKPESEERLRQFLRDREQRGEGS